jgi:tryptophan synthase beta chain
MTAYESFQAGTMSDFIPTDEDLKVSIDKLPKIPGIQ